VQSPPDQGRSHNAIQSASASTTKSLKRAWRPGEFDYAGKNHKRECEQERLATVAKTKGNAGHKINSKMFEVVG